MNREGFGVLRMTGFSFVSRARQIRSRRVTRAAWVSCGPLFAASGGRGEDPPQPARARARAPRRMRAVAARGIGRRTLWMWRACRHRTPVLSRRVAGARQAIRCGRERRTAAEGGAVPRPARGRAVPDPQSRDVGDGEGAGGVTRLPGIGDQQRRAVLSRWGGLDGEASSGRGLLGHVRVGVRG